MIGLLASAVGMVIAILIDLGSAHLRFPRATCYLFSLSAGFLVSIVAVLFMQPADYVATLAITVLAYGSWWYAFLNIVQSLESSLRVRLLGEVRGAGGSMSVKDLQLIYNDVFLLRLRLDRLLSHGAVIEKDGRLFVVSHGLKAIAKVFATLKIVLLGRLSEFESQSK